MEEKMNTPSSAAPSNYNIFFSHKVKDEPVTRKIIDSLHRHTDNVQCFISEDIEKGKNWRDEIAEHLKLSSLLVLVFTDPEEDWGWCLYETGFFDALTQISDATQARRIYCLHNPSATPPSPIANLQTIAAEPEDVSRWLSGLFEYTKQTKKEFLNDIPEIANQICGLFASAKKSIYCAKSINIVLQCSSLKSVDDLPEDTIIKGDSGIMEELFGTNSGEIDWKSAKERFSEFPNSSEANFSALKEISRAAYCVCNNKKVLPIQGTVFVEQGPKRYRPVISHANKLSTGRVSCQILLIEEVGGQLQNVDKYLGALLTGIRMGVRIRWEVIRPFISKIRILASIDPRKLRLDLQTCFNNIFIEGEFRGIYSPADVWDAFESSEDQSKILGMIEGFDHTYRKIWKGLGFIDVTETFGEVSNQPFSDQDLALLDTGLRELEKMNRDFLDIAVARAEVLIREELGITTQSAGIVAHA
jgi:TIR domain